ncbi:MULTISPECIES: carbohydrate ABC transporter permease [Streptomyces]|uniref:Sugar ABC transporter permease n=2 Tax=Streptomyces TaxID=1883 RepID=A0ABS9JQB4_9ACTN|nr:MULTISPECIES: sugar ABC transporter permease [Streptomyces]MCG0067774.1 sugar ABC transporter permease [Streptomyces tricolor]MYU30344.1 ABC transporter permease subunit [Streptomyces sp. SID7810]BCM69803.1 putative multiple sugar ABC transporter permease protein [Streptomyces sp. EAS-AB2608]CUW31414.1 Lactose transport system permease protein LacF [Streptomyces reticuli]
MVNALVPETAGRAPGPRAAEPGAGGLDRLRRRRRRQTVVAYLFLAPTLLFFAVFLVLPLGFALLLSLSRWSGFDLGDIDPVGPDNFAALFADGATFLTPVLTNTLLFALGTVALALAGSVLVATCIDKLRFQGLWRTLYFLPIVTTVVAVGNVWKYMYEPGGLVNGVLNALGLGSVAFLQDPDTALPAVVVVQAWASLGTAILVLTAGLKSIPGTYYEAAALDGAGPVTVFRRITLPLLRPSLLFVCVTQFLIGLQSFALIIVMTKGGPGNATDVAALEMYRQAFSYGDWGAASAAAFVLFAVVLAVTLAQLWVFRRTGEDA